MMTLSLALTCSTLLALSPSEVLDQRVAERFASQEGYVWTVSESEADRGAAPVVTKQPVSQKVQAGATVSFSIEYTGDPAPEIHWFKVDGEKLDQVHADEATWTLPSVTKENAGEYIVVLRNKFDFVVSTPFTLEVL